MMSTIELASYAAMLSRDRAIVPSTLSFTLNLTTATDPLPVIPLASMIPAQSLPGFPGETRGLSRRLLTIYLV
ncbi:MAG: hypothetical protein CM1200mP27_09870 [Chloroflexota bacterium]|nr:MAG: hypothetical protein CM1200mP27_09870 [Chloroflexota bacterium]